MKGRAKQIKKIYRDDLFSLENESWKVCISSVYGYWVLCFWIEVVTKNMAFLKFSIYFPMSILLKHKKVLTSLKKGVKISIHVSYDAHCIKLSHAGFVYK